MNELLLPRITMNFFSELLWMSYSYHELQWFLTVNWNEQVILTMILTIRLEVADCQLYFYCLNAGASFEIAKNPFSGSMTQELQTVLYMFNASLRRGLLYRNIEQIICLFSAIKWYFKSKENIKVKYVYATAWVSCVEVWSCSFGRCN